MLNSSAMFKLLFPLKCIFPYIVFCITLFMFWEIKCWIWNWNWNRWILFHYDHWKHCDTDIDIKSSSRSLCSNDWSGWFSRLPLWWQQSWDVASGHFYRVSLSRTQNSNFIETKRKGARLGLILEKSRGGGREEHHHCWQHTRAHSGASHLPGSHWHSAIW